MHVPPDEESQPMHPGTPRATDRPHPSYWLAFAFVVAVGIAMRFHQIGGQIVADDEWHSVNFLAENDYHTIFRRFGASDHCIPQTLLAKWIADRWGLSELTLRAPVLVAGVLALVVLPLLVRRRLGSATSLVFAGLLAISPLHVYFSRYARPYAIVFLLGVTGALAFERWARTRSHALAALYVVCAILGTWFHAATGPLALAPIAWYALFGRAASGASFWARVRSLLPVLVLVLAGLAALLWPPIAEDWGAIDEKAGFTGLTAAALGDAYVLASGVPDRLPGLVFDVGCLAGLIFLWRRERGLLGYFLFLFGCELAALAVSRPFALDAGIVVARYTIPVLGFLLIVAARGLVSLGEWTAREVPRWPRQALPVIACTALLAFGPIAPWFDPENAVYYRPNNWTNHGNVQTQHLRWQRRQAAGMARHGIPAFYEKLGLARGPAVGGQPILEGPMRVPWAHNPFYVYQRVHRRPTYLGFVRAPGVQIETALLIPGDPRFRFERLVDFDDFEGIAARGIRFVVFHKNMNEELGRGDFESVDPAPVIERYRSRFLEPVYEDARICVFDVRRAPDAAGG